MGFCTSSGAPSPAIDAAAANFSALCGAPPGRRFASPRERDTFRHCEETGAHRNIFRENKSGRSIVIPDWRGTGDLGREYALVYRAGLLNQTGRPVGVGLPDKLYDFAHLVTSAGNLEEIFPPNIASVSDDANIVPRAFKNVGPSFVRQPDRLACIAPGLCACYAKALRTLRKW